MFFLVELLAWMTDIHKVDWGFIFVPIMLMIAGQTLCEVGAKSFVCSIGYTMTLNTIAILLLPVTGIAPHFWWAWGWTFAFIPVFNWWKPMLLIVSVNIILMFWMYNHGWKKELDEYGLIGLLPVPTECLNWPCTDFSGSSLYMNRAQHKADAKAKKEAEASAAKAKKEADATAAKARPVTVDSQLPALPKEMYMFSR